MLRKLLIMAGLLIVVSSCQNKSNERFTTSSKEIDLLKKGLENYEDANWKEWIKQYSDSAKIYQNTWTSWKTPEETRTSHEQIIAQLSSYSFEKKELFFEQIIDDRGRTWVNFWGLWKGTLKVNNKSIEIPVHLTILVADGKVINEYGYWNSAKLNEELKKAQLASSTIKNLKEN